MRLFAPFLFSPLVCLRMTVTWGKDMLGELAFHLAFHVPSPDMLCGKMVEGNGSGRRFSPDGPF
jgi:hypothetical protein